MNQSDNLCRTRERDARAVNGKIAVTCQFASVELFVDVTRGHRSSLNHHQHPRPFNHTNLADEDDGVPDLRTQCGQNLVSSSSPVIRRQRMARMSSPRRNTATFSTKLSSNTRICPCFMLMSLELLHPNLRHHLHHLCTANATCSSACPSPPSGTTWMHTERHHHPYQVYPRK